MVKTNTPASPERPSNPTPSQPEPIKVRVLRFVAPMDAHGLSVASSASDCENSKAGRLSRLRIAYMPWLRHFRLEYDPGDGSERRVSMIHETQVKSWDPA